MINIVGIDVSGFLELIQALNPKLSESHLPISPNPKP